MFELKSMQTGMSRVINSPCTKVQTGALVFTNKARFYISVSLGEFFYQGDRYYAISLESPLAKKMLNMQVNDEFILNGIHQKILEIL